MTDDFFGEGAKTSTLKFIIIQNSFFFDASHRLTELAQLEQLNKILRYEEKKAKKIIKKSVAKITDI